MTEQSTRTRVLFTESGRPLQGLQVRPSSGETMETDTNGQVELCFADGAQQLEIFRDGEWKPQLVEGSHESSLIIVDLARRDTRELKAARADTATVLDIGKLNLGKRYRYHEVIGRGGMSIVLRAHDRLLSRDVAIKVLSPALSADLEAQESFLKEARSLATLSHPNLVAVHDICKADEQVFIVLEYVQGENLEKIVESVGGLEEQSGLRLLVQLARVVSYMHERGVVHRDLKPSNALIRADGTLKLIDFGLARRFDDLFIRGTQVRGTPGYMSPEQFKGEALTPACDVYMLGVCMFQVLTGDLPFSKGDMGYAHVHEPAPRVDAVNPRISSELADLVDACLQKSPGDRPGDGKELLKLLQEIYQGAASGADEEEPRDPETVEFDASPEEIERLTREADSEVINDAPDEDPAAEQATESGVVEGRDPRAPADDSLEVISEAPASVHQAVTAPHPAVEPDAAAEESGALEPPPPPKHPANHADTTMELSTEPSPRGPSAPLLESDADRERRLLETAEVVRLALADPAVRTQLDVERNQSRWAPVVAASLFSALATAALVYFMVLQPAANSAQSGVLNSDAEAARIAPPVDPAVANPPPADINQLQHGQPTVNPSMGNPPQQDHAVHPPGPSAVPVAERTDEKIVPSDAVDPNATPDQDGEVAAAESADGSKVKSPSDGSPDSPPSNPPVAETTEPTVDERDGPESTTDEPSGDELAGNEEPGEKTDDEPSGESAKKETAETGSRPVRKTSSGFLRPLGSSSTSQGSP